MKQPTPRAVARARETAGLTQAQAAELCYMGHLTRWSEAERGIREIDLAKWELFLIKTGQHKHYGPRVAEAA